MPYLEDKELPFNSIEQPNKETSIKLADKSTLELCTDFLLDLQKHYLNKDLKALTQLYKRDYKQLKTHLFSKNEQFVSPQQIEEHLEKDIDLMSQFLYMDLQNKHSSQSNKNKDSTLETREELWMNYLDIFKTIQTENVLLPFEWIADLLDSFTDQLVENSSWLSQQQQKVEDDFWNLNQTLEILTALSNLQKDDNEDDCQYYYGLFSKVQLVKLNFQLNQICNSKEVMKTIQFKHLELMQHNMSVYLELLYLNCLMYLFEDKIQIAYDLCLASYKIAIKLNENSNRWVNKLCSLTLFIMNFKQDLINYDAQLVKSIQQMLNLDDNLVKKLKEHDQSAFSDLYDQSILQYHDIIPDQQFKVNTQSQDWNKNQKQQMMQKLQINQQLYCLAQKFKLYSTLKLEKASKILGLDKQKIVDLIQNYKNECQLTDESKFEQTVVRRVLKEKNQLQIIIENEFIKVFEKKNQTNYLEYFERNIQTIEGMKNELESLDQNIQFII